jgi:fibronectin-binding autotransporter adhesin
MGRSNRKNASARGFRSRTSILVAAGAAAAAAALTAASPALADVWDNSSADGFWSTASNWADDSEPTSADNVFFPAGFPGGANVIFLDNSPPETAVGVFFSDDYTLTGFPIDSKLELFSPGNIGVDPGKTVNINSMLQNFSGLTKVGAGTLVLNNASNSFTGNVSIAAGTLKPGPGALGTNPIFISPGAALEINGTHFTQSLSLDAGTLRGLGIASWSGTITVGSASTSSFVTGASASDSFTIGNADNDLTGGASATATVSGAGTLILPFSNNYSGGWEITGGTLRMGNSGSLGTGTTPLVIGPGAAKLEIPLNTTITRGLTLNNGASVKLTSGASSIPSNIAIAPGAGVTFETNSFFDTLNIGDASAGLSGGGPGGGGSSSITFTGGGFFVLGYASAYTGTLIGNNATVRISADDQLGNAANPVRLTNSLMVIALGSGPVNSSRNITNLGGSVLAAASGSTWTLNGTLSSTADLYAQGDGNVSINGPQSYAAGSTLILNGGVGMVTLNTDAGTPTSKNLTVNVSFSNVTFNATQHLASLTVNGGRSATLTVGGNKIIVATTLSASGKLDLGDGKFITTSPIGSLVGTNYTGITGMIRAGRNGNTVPLWDGSGGIVTSQTTATAGNLHSIGVARGSEVRSQTTSTTALWGGQTITGTDTLVMYTYGGDANLDGKINIDDYIRIDNGLAGNLKGWSNGDFNYDGKVSIDDYITVIDANIGNQNGFVFPTAGGMSESVVAIPEPGTLGFVAFTVIGWRRRRQPK